MCGGDESNSVSRVLLFQSVTGAHTHTYTLHNLFIGGGLLERIMLVSAEPSPQLPAAEVASEEIKGHNILLPNLLSITGGNF